MILQVMTYAWGVAIIISVFVLIFALLRIVFYKLRDEKVQNSTIYSFRLVRKTGCWFLLISFAISGVIYFSTESFDIAISILAFFIACTFAGLLKGLLFEHHARRRGVKKLAMRITMASTLTLQKAATQGTPTVRLLKPKTANQPYSPS